MISKKQKRQAIQDALKGKPIPMPLPPITGMRLCSTDEHGDTVFFENKKIYTQAEFDQYLIDPTADVGKPDPDYDEKPAHKPTFFERVVEAFTPEKKKDQQRDLRLTAQQREKSESEKLREYVDNIGENFDEHMDIQREHKKIRKSFLLSDDTAPEFVTTHRLRGYKF